MLSFRSPFKLNEATQVLNSTLIGHRRVCVVVCGGVCGGVSCVWCAVVCYLELARSGTDDQECAINGRNVLAAENVKKKKEKSNDSKNIFCVL